MMNERDTMLIAGRRAPMAILALVLIPGDGLYKVGDGRVVAFVKVEGAADGSVVEELTDLREVLNCGVAEASDGSMTSIVMLTPTLPPREHSEKPR